MRAGGLAFCAVLLVGCSSPAAPIPIPSVTASKGRAMTETPPSEGITAEVVGMTESEAVTAIEEEGMTARVTSVDGKGRPVTADYREDRVNLEVEAGSVVSASIG